MSKKDKDATDVAENTEEATPEVTEEPTSETESPEKEENSSTSSESSEKEITAKRDPATKKKDKESGEKPKAKKKSASKAQSQTKKLPHGKKYRTYAQSFNRQKKHLLSEGVDVLLEAKELTKFDATAEIHLNLGVDPKHADQAVRSTVILPHGTGKKVKIVAFVDESQVKEAKAAGAMEAGTEDLIAKIEKGWTDFDIAIAAPDQMKLIGKVAKTLGQKGLMPNPKAGTVTPDIKKTIEEISTGKVEFRVDKLGNLHNSVGKLSFGKEKLTENIQKYMKAVQDAKPTGVKGTYIRSITLTSTMGPGIKVDTGKLDS
jgi:large subunit ribosomal protein L1